MELTQLLYIDPAATSVLISSLTAIVVAVGASAIVIWRKFKKKVDKTLNKDPNANKEVEDELVINDETAEAAPAEESAAKEETPEENTAQEAAPAEENAPAEAAPSEEKPKAKTTRKKTK